MEVENPGSMLIRLNGEGYGEIEVDFGMIGDYMRQAAKIAVTYGIPIQFMFNEKIYRVTPEEARNHLTRDNIKKTISLSYGLIRNLHSKIEQEEAKIEEEKRLGVILYGEDF